MRKPHTIDGRFVKNQGRVLSPIQGESLYHAQVICELIANMQNCSLWDRI